jgi:hypothetical protein
MKPARRSLIVSLAALLPLAGCVYYPPVAPASYPFERHPGVSAEVSWHYDAGGMAYSVTNLVNRSPMDKCAWTQVHPSRLLRTGDSWQVGQGQSPGGIGVANVMPGDPQCANAKREHTGQR